MKGYHPSKGGVTFASSYYLIVIA